MSKTAEYWIQKLSLSPHPEGGFFKEIYRSQDVVKSSGNDEDRKASTSIYYLLKQGQYSSWHTLKSDEIWHHYDGSDIKIYIFDRKNKQLSIKICGRESENASFQVLIPKNTWFAAELAEGKYALVGCTGMSRNLYY